MLWSGLEAICLPKDIRGLIEDTYRDMPDEPEAWQALKNRLIANRDKMASLALRQSNPWQFQLDDKEDVRTRWNSCPSVELFMVRRVTAWDATNGAELEMLDGTTCRMRSGVFDIQAARVLHRNMVRVPCWSVAEVVANQRLPFWSRPYLRGEAQLVLVSEGDVATCPEGEPIGLQYRDDLGIVMPVRAKCGNRKATTREEEDEPYDW